MIHVCWSSYLLLVNYLVDVAWRWQISILFLGYLWDALQYPVLFSVSVLRLHNMFVSFLSFNPFHICFTRFFTQQWVIFIWDCIRRNAQKLWRTSQRTVVMVIMIISFFTGSLKASWYKREIPWEMALADNLFGEESLKMNSIKGDYFF